MSDSSKSEPFGSDSGSEYLPGKGQKSYYNKMDSENDSSDTHENDDGSSGSSGTKKKKQPHSQMLESGGTEGQVKDFFHVEVEVGNRSKKNNDKIAKCIPCFEKFGKSV